MATAYLTQQLHHGLGQLKLARCTEHHQSATALLEIQLARLCQVLHELLTVTRKAQQALLILFVTG